MTEIEMDLDMAKSDLNGRNEDDMIDFDTEMADSNQDFEKLDVNLEGVDREMEETEDVTDHHTYETNGMIGEDVEFDLHDVNDTAHSLEPVDYEGSEAPELQKQDPAVTSQSSNDEEQEYDSNPGDLNDTATQKDNILDDRASIHEIDYEFEEDAELHKPQQDVTTETTNQPANSEEKQATDPAASHKTQESGDNTPVPEQDTVEQVPEERHAPSSHDDQDKSLDPQEAPTEHDGAALENIEAGDLAVDDHAQVDTSNGNQEFYEEEHTLSHEEAVVPGTGHDLETVGEVKATEDGGYEVGEDEHNEDQLVDTEHAELSASDEDLNGKPNDDFPAITVQYKGDEFPMFSTTTNSFFADTSVLDQPLEELLAGLRTELENEIAADDDLVLQVDELGLELSEATQGELMTNYTFRQVLQIFDVLVRNQDPDSSRTMYTYLFTKPNAEKRLESLFESATAGKGLDEVIHLFETPMTVDTSMLETAATIDGVHEELDEFDSPVDENAGNGENGNNHHDEADEPDEPEVDDEYPVNEHANLEAATLDVQEVASHEDASRDIEEVTTETQVATAAIASTNAEALLEVIEEPNTTIESEDHEQNAHAESEVDPFANFELDDDAEVNDNVVVEATEEIEETEENDFGKPEVTSAQTNGTSTTTTLQEEEEAAFFNIDLGEVSTESEATKVHTGENDLDEIDWRDEPEADGQEPTTPSAAGKRSRGDDDEHDAEVEQDAKRRRP